MKNRIKVLLFLIGVLSIYFFVKDKININIIQGFSILVSLSAIFIAFFIFFENRDPARTLAWLVVLGIFPLFGFFFYLLFGQSFQKERRFHKKAHYDELARRKLVQTKMDFEPFEQIFGPSYDKLLHLSKKLTEHPISTSTATKILTNGEETFQEILLALQEAKHHIHLEYYIVRNDELGNKIKQILIDKVKSGVEVRFLYDHVGSWSLDKKYVQDLRRHGVKIQAFSPVKFSYLSSQINYRNHRKIIVIDGNIGFIGGLNIGDEYLGKVPSFGFWRDTHMLVKGEAVRNLQFIFMQDWTYTSGEVFDDKGIYFKTTKEQTDGVVQIVAGGPDTAHQVIKNLFFTMITSAKKSIYIASPYFIPDHDVLTALRIAGLSGIDVRILFPKHPDKQMVYHASRSYFPMLLEAGIKIYEYEAGFMHSKFIIVDEKMASIGTANMDMRSFHLNFEVNVFLYLSSSIDKLVSAFLYDLDESNPIHEDAFNKRSLKVRFYESLSRLSSPLL